MIRPYIQLLILSCAAALFSISCSNEKAPKVKISVTTNDRTVKSLKVNSSDMLTFEPILLSEAKFDSTGRATLEFNLPHPTFAFFELGKKWVSLYLEPGYDLELNLDTLNENAIRFSGKGAEANNYLVQSQRIYKTYRQRGGKNFWELTPFELIGRLDSLRKDYASFHLRYCDSTNLSKSTSLILELNNKLMLISFKQNFLLTHSIDSAVKDQYPEQLLNISKEITFEDDLLSYRMDNYALVLYWYLELELKRPSLESKKRTENTDELIPAIINDSIAKDKKYPAGVKEFLIVNNIYSSMKRSGLTPVTDSLFNGFIHTYPSSEYLPQLQSLADKCLAISPGSIAPDITGTTIDGKSLSLKELRGKVVYVDVWATWCGPCRKEFPFSKEIEEKFVQDDKVVFLFVSIDQDKAAWRKMVTDEKELKGIHINLLEEQMRKSYLISGVPWFILIDHEGKIVNAEAPKPSSGKVENAIREQLRRIKS